MYARSSLPHSCVLSQGISHINTWDAQSATAPAVQAATWSRRKFWKVVVLAHAGLVWNWSGLLCTLSVTRIQSKCPFADALLRLGLFPSCTFSYGFPFRMHHVLLVVIASGERVDLWATPSLRCSNTKLPASLGVRR